MSIKKTDITETDDDSGGSQSKGQTYLSILKQLGIDPKGISIDGIQKIIHEYKNRLKEKSAKIVGMDGKPVEQTYKGKQERVYTVKHDESGPAKTSELPQESSDYNKRSDKEEGHKPSGPVFPNKPKSP